MTLLEHLVQEEHVMEMEIVIHGIMEVGVVVVSVVEEEHKQELFIV